MRIFNPVLALVLVLACVATAFAVSNSFDKTAKPLESDENYTMVFAGSDFSELEEEDVNATVFLSSGNGVSLTEDTNTTLATKATAEDDDSGDEDGDEDGDDDSDDDSDDEGNEE